MKLYVTPMGRWTSSQAEARALGKEDGGWTAREVPTDKAALLGFLNELRVGAVAVEPSRPERPVTSGARRWRVYVKGLFACVVHADSKSAADAKVRELTELREVRRG